MLASLSIEKFFPQFSLDALNVPELFLQLADLLQVGLDYVDERLSRVLEVVHNHERQDFLRVFLLR